MYIHVYMRWTCMYTCCTNQYLLWARADTPQVEADNVFFPILFCVSMLSVCQTLYQLFMCAKNQSVCWHTWSHCVTARVCVRAHTSGALTYLLYMCEHTHSIHKKQHLECACVRVCACVHTLSSSPSCSRSLRKSSALPGVVVSSYAVASPLLGSHDNMSQSVSS
jgi:hypothetical protein